MDRTPQPALSDTLKGKRVIILSKLAGMSKREAARILRQHGAVLSAQDDARVDIVVIGEDGLPLDEQGGLDERLQRLSQSDGTQADVEILSETQLWERLGLVEAQQHVRRLYTPAMLADLLKIPISVVRRWHRRGLIMPAREVRRLPYFDFQEVATARRLAELLAAGISAPKIEKQLAAVARFLPGVERPLAQLSVIVEGKEILLRQGDGLVDAGGQYRFDFESQGADDQNRIAAALEAVRAESEPQRAPQMPDELIRLAGELEDAGQLEGASETYRAALAAGGPDAGICFLLAELLYRLGETGAARERYYMAIELNEEFVEARANLGCVLAETGQRELAVAAFEGALHYHPDFPDVHYHLARTLDEMERREDAERHWLRFLELAPDSPWAEEARERCT